MIAPAAPLLPAPFGPAAPYPALVFEQRQAPLQRINGILDDVVQEGPPFQIVVSQNWYVPALTQALCRCALRIATTQSQFNNCVLIWRKSQEPQCFVWIWMAAMMVWLLMALQCTLAEIKRDRRTGDFAFVPLSAANGWKAKFWLMVHQGTLFASIFVLDLLNVPGDLRYLVVRLHMGGIINRRIYGADPLRFQIPFHNDAQHRYVVIEYQDECLHNFQNTETATVHWVVHLVSAFMLYVNFNQVFGSAILEGKPANLTAIPSANLTTIPLDSQDDLFIPACSLCLTACSIALEIYNAYQYCKVRRAYKTYWQGLQRTGTWAQQQQAAVILRSFWF